MAKLDNRQIYQKTLGFSYRRFFWDFLSFIIFVGLMVIGFLVAENTFNLGLVGLFIGAILGIAAMAIISRFLAYRAKAGQIAMMTKGITEDSLPADVIGEGYKIVKERFSTVAAYFAVTSVIKGIFHQIGQGITAAGKMVGGDTGGAIGGGVASAVETVISYLCDCCLGWVFYRKDEKATRATLEGGAIFFKHGKVLIKNVGRIFGISLLSFLVVGGVFFGLAYLIMLCFRDAFVGLSAEMVGSADLSDSGASFFSDPNNLMLVCAGAVGVIFWLMIHSVFIRPFILVGVLRNFLNSGINDAPTAADYEAISKKSPKFRKLQESE